MRLERKVFDGPAADSEIESFRYSEKLPISGSNSSTAAALTGSTGVTGPLATVAQAGLTINLVYDSSANSAPAAFKSALNYVVNLLEATFTDAVTININVGWGEVGGQALGGALGASIRATAPAYTYSQVRNALISDSTSSADAAAVASLPASDPTKGGNFDIGTAAAKAIGLLAPNGSAVDGWIGFTSVSNTFTFDPNNRAVPGQYDFIGVALHEITEVMGRVAWLGNFIDYPNAYSVMDLFRYSAAGQRQLVGGQQAYFSSNNGQTHLDNFNTNAGGDYGDWAASAGNDAFLAFSSSNVANALTGTDITVLDAIGWNTKTLPSAATVVSVVASGSGIASGSGDLGAGKIVSLTVSMNQAVTVSGGTPTLSLNDGGTATYVSGSGTTTLLFNHVVTQGQNTADLQVSGFNLNGATIIDAGGNSPDFSGAVTNPVGILQIDTTPPVISSLVLTGAGISGGSGDVGAGEVITLTVNMSEAVSVTGGVPTLTLNDGGFATFVSGAGSSILTFTTTVAAGQNTSDLQISGVNLNGAAIADGAGNSAGLSSLPIDPVGTLKIDTAAPAVNSVVITGTGVTGGNGNLGSGQVITFTANFSEAVLLTGGVPTLTLNDGGVATYTGGSGSSELTFSSTIAQGQNTPDLQIVGLNLNGATVYDGAANPADLSGLTVNPIGILQVDTLSPTLTSIAETPNSGTVTPGKTIVIALGFSESVFVAGGIATLALNDGGTAVYQSGSGTASLTFSYSVAATDSNTQSLSVVAIHSGLATISDGAGNSAGLSLAGLIQTGPLVDTTIPAVTHVTTSPATGTLHAGNLVTISLALNEAATVAGGTPTLLLNDGGTATYDAHNSTATSLTFDYTVGPTDQTTNLAIMAVKLPAGTTVRDIIGHDTVFSNAMDGHGTGLQIGTLAKNVIAGGSGNETFYAFGTNASLVGGGGHDALILDGAKSQYSITLNGDGSFTITDSVANRDFSHVVTNIEQLQFTDKTVFVENADNANVARLYSAAFNRPPDVSGLSGWEDIYSSHISTAAKAGGVYLSLAQTSDGFGTSIAGGFIQSVEFQAKFGSLTDSAFVTQLYLNVLNRVPSSTELNGWLGLIHNGDANGTHFTRDMVLVGFAESTENIAKTAADWLIQI